MDNLNTKTKYTYNKHNSFFSFKRKKEINEKDLIKKQTNMIRKESGINIKEGKFFNIWREHEKGIQKLYKLFH